MRKMKFIGEFINFLENKRFSHEKGYQEVGAISRILQTYRLYVLKKRLFNMLYWLKYSKVIIIQRFVRGYLTRKKYQQFAKNRILRQQTEKKSAIIIQKVFHRCVAEKKYLRYYQQKQQRKQVHHQMKLLKLAEGVSFSQKCTLMGLKLYRKCRPFRYLILNEKAIMIQKIYRGYHGKQRMKFVKLHNYLNDFYKKQNIQMKAIRKIQRVWRGCNMR
jgi:hypothetical protein